MRVARRAQPQLHGERSVRPLLLGMARSDGMRGPALVPSERGRTSAADRLLMISCMDRDEFLLKFVRRNLLPYGKWSNVKAKLRGHRLRKRLRGRVIVLGKQTWSALHLPAMPFFTHIYTGKAEFVLVPHPSGRCRSYNEIKNRARLRKILRGEE